MGREQHSGQALKRPYIVGLFCPYSRSLLTLGWSTQAELICHAAAAAAEKHFQGMYPPPHMTHMYPPLERQQIACVANVLLMCC
jgi:hypothetical protein